MTICAARADAFLTSSSLSLLLGRLRIRLPPQALRFSRGRGERETRVTGDEPQGTMGRVQTAGEARLARCLLPAFPWAHIFIERETSGYEAAHRRRHLRIAVTRKSSSWSPLSHVLFGKRRAICTTSARQIVSSQIFRIGWFLASEQERQLTTVRANQNNWLDQWQSGKLGIRDPG